MSAHHHAWSNSSVVRAVGCRSSGPGSNPGAPFLADVDGRGTDQESRSSASIDEGFLAGSSKVIDVTRAVSYHSISSGVAKKAVLARGTSLPHLFPNGWGESGWCSGATSTHRAWRHAGFRFLLPGVSDRMDPQLKLCAYGGSRNKGGAKCTPWLRRPMLYPLGHGARCLRCASRGSAFRHSRFQCRGSRRARAHERAHHGATSSRHSALMFNGPRRV